MTRGNKTRRVTPTRPQLAAKPAAAPNPPASATTGANTGAATVAPSTELERTIAALQEPAPVAPLAPVPPIEPATPAPEPIDEEPVIEVATEQPPVSRQPTLAELNRQAWAIDDEHAAKRREAEAAIAEVAEPLLRGVQRGRGRIRRFQKPLRPPVTK